MKRGTSCVNGTCEQCRVPQFLKGELVAVGKLGEGLARARVRFGAEETIISVPIDCPSLAKKSCWHPSMVQLEQLRTSGRKSHNDGIDPY